jgi:hypothetical protein
VDRRILHYSRDDPTIRYIEPQIHNPIQSGGEVSNVQLFPDGLRLALHRAEDREALRKRKEETSDRLTQGARLWNEKGITDQTASEEVALRSAVHDIQEWVQHKRAAEVESKIAEEKSIGEARQEAEEPWDRELSLDKVVSWLKWKSGEISLDILELDELLGDTRTQMGEAAQRAANLWEWKTKAEKTGSSGEVRELENRWGDERTIVRELKRKSDNIEDQKSDKLLSKRILDEMAVDGETSVRVIAKKARAASGTEVSSFATMLQRYIDKRVGWQQRKRHVKRSIKKTIKITLITMGVLLLVGSCIAGILQKH